jgi:hypothetical protein
MKLFSLIPILLYHVLPSVASFGPFFMLWMPDDAPKIIDFVTTMQLPTAPNPPMPHGILTVWPGLITEDTSFIQALAILYSQDWLHTSGCHLTSTSQYCVMGYAIADRYTHIYISPEQVRMEGNTQFEIHYWWDEKSNNMSQIVSQHGQQIAYMSTSKWFTTSSIQETH